MESSARGPVLASCGFSLSAATAGVRNPNLASVVEAPPLVVYSGEATSLQLPFDSGSDPFVGLILEQATKVPYFAYSGMSPPTVRTCSGFLPFDHLASGPVSVPGPRSDLLPGLFLLLTVPLLQA